MTLVCIPEKTRIRIVNSVQSQWSDIMLKADTTVDARLMPAAHIRVGTVSRTDGSVRPLKGEHSEHVRVELHQRYGTTDVHTLVERGLTCNKGNDILVELRPWMATWRGTNGETYLCELLGDIDKYLSAVHVVVDAVTEVDPHTVEVRIGDSTVRLPKREVLEIGVAPVTTGGGTYIKLEVNDAARYGWLVDA